MRAASSARLAAGLLLGLAIVFALMSAALTHRTASGLEEAYGQAMLRVAALIGSEPPAAPASNRAIIQGLDPRIIANAGRNAYTGLCAECHGAKGDGRGPVGQLGFPPATDLTAEPTREKSDAELRWIIRNGLGFTAMPAFADSLPEDDMSSLVAYLRALQAGQAQPVPVPTPTSQQLSAADPNGGAVQRGAAAFYAQSCHLCHGPTGEAPEELAIQDISQLRDTLRRGRPGMPVYASSKLTDAQIDDVLAYLESVPQTNGE
ncbi:MAG TPA: c-type cytochrome [Chloroflexota bacterium]